MHSIETVQEDLLSVVNTLYKGGLMRSPNPPRYAVKGTLLVEA